jgi:hypothetical protein
MVLFIICVLAIIALGVYVTVKTKPVKAHEPTSLPIPEEEPQDPTPPTEIDLGIPDPPKMQPPLTPAIDNKEVVKDQQKSKRKYNKKTKK